MTVSCAYHPGEIIVSFALSFISSYNAVCFADIYRLSAHHAPKYFTSSIQLIFMSISIGGGAIWSMHFTGMAAISLETKNGHNIPLRYNVGTTILSLIAAIVCVYFGLIISTRDRVYTKDKEELFLMFTEDMKYLPPSSSTTYDRKALHRLAFLKGLNYLCIGGIITGGGVCIMHYIGMMALSSPNILLIIRWNAGLVAFSVIIAIVASTTAFWILFRLLPLFPSWESLRITSALVMAIAVCGMHYTGMTAASYEILSHPSQSNEISVGQTMMKSTTSGFVAVVSSLIMNWFFSMVIQSELRYSSFTRSQQLERANKELKEYHEKYPRHDSKPAKYSKNYSEGDLQSLPSCTLTHNSKSLMPQNKASIIPMEILSGEDIEDLECQQLS